MDAALFIAVKKGTSIPTTEMRRKTLTWEGVAYEDDSAIHIYGNCQFKPSQVSGWVINMLPLELQNAELESYLVDDSAVTLLESEVNGIELDEPSTLPNWLLEILKGSEIWLVAFLWHWDEVDEIECANIEGAIEKLRSTLSWNGNRHGFCVYSCPPNAPEKSH